tara:strand:+ start:1812 stop:2591 length:780 start_codon:yes stop_codon:yes gene_type:complete
MFLLDDILWILISIADDVTCINLRAVNLTLHRMTEERMQKEVKEHSNHLNIQPNSSVFVWYNLKRIVANMHFRLGTDECVIHGKIKQCQDYFVFDGKSYIDVTFQRILKPPFTVMFVGKAQGDNTYFDGKNRVFEVCHGFPVKNELRICINLGKTILYGMTNEVKLNVYTLVMDENDNMTLRVNGMLERTANIQNIKLDGLIIGASRKKNFCLKGCLKHFFITRQAISDEMLQFLECSIARSSSLARASKKNMLIYSTT